jgi:hypothetical protein
MDRNKERTGRDREIKSRSRIDRRGPAEGKRSLGAHRRVVKGIVLQLMGGEVSEEEGSLVVVRRFG